MNENDRATDGFSPTDDDLTQQIARALRSREPAQADTTVAAARIEASLAQAQVAPRSHVTQLTRRGGQVVAAGVVVSALAVAGAGAAAAANPYSSMARVVENVVQSVGIEWSAMPDGYTREQYEAFWGAGYSAEDVDQLSDLWSTDATETKARAGQLLLDGQLPPITASGAEDASPSSTGMYTEAQADALWDAGYEFDDVEALSALWGTEITETKARAGQLILDGATLPIAPGEADASSGE